MRLDLSMEDGHVHIHVLLEATPGWTAYHWVRAYWFRRHGRVYPDKDELRNQVGYSIYCDRQSIHTMGSTAIPAAIRH